jgi:acyl carrier protein
MNEAHLVFVSVQCGTVYMDDVYARLNDIFYDIFDDDTIVVTPELTASDIPEWDSLNHIKLMLTVQKVFKMKFSAAEIANLKNVGELADLIRGKTVVS